MTDYRKKYLDCFFMWQDIVGKMMASMEELKEELKKLEEENKELREKLKDVSAS